MKVLLVGVGRRTRNRMSNFVHVHFCRNRMFEKDDDRDAFHNLFACIKRLHVSVREQTYEQEDENEGFKQGAVVPELQMADGKQKVSQKVAPDTSANQKPTVITIFNNYQNSNLNSIKTT